MDVHGFSSFAEPNSITCGPDEARIQRRRSPVKIPALVGLVLLLALTQGVQAAAAQQVAKVQSVARAKLPNGLRVVVVQNTLAPVVTTMMNYLVGSNEAPTGFPGMAHALEHMMFRGSPGLSADQLADISAAMGGMFNADTQQTVTQYFFTVPAEDLDVALHIQATRMRGVLDSASLWEHERGAIEQEVASDMSNPQYVFYTKLLASMFKGTPLAHDALGTRPSFQKTTAAMLKQFHDSWYAPNNAILVIVGNVDPAKALAEVKSLFSDIPTKNLPEHPAVHLQPVKAESLNLTTDLPYGLAVIAFRMPGSSSPDYAAAQVLSDVLSSQRGTFYALVPQGKALFAGFAVSSLPHASLGYALAAFPKGADGQKLSAEVRQILAGDIRNGVPADLVTASKRHELAGAEFEKNSVSGLASAWSEAVAVEGRNSPEEDVAAIQRVTVDDVNRAARKYLKLDETISAVLTPQASGKPVSTKSFGGKESFAPNQTKPVALPEWAQRAVERLTVPKATLHPQVSTLSNGIRLIVQPATISDTISVYGHIDNNPDLEVPDGQEGVSSVLGRLFSFGTTTLNRLQFQEALDEIGADESAGTSFSVHALASHFDRAVELLADNELQPALPEQAFRIVQPQLARAVAGQLQSPDYLTGRAIHTALFPKDDPTLRQATPETISALNLTDVKGYYQHVFRPDLATIVVIGHITPEEAKATVEKYFGSWRSQGPKPPTVLPAVPSNKRSSTAVPNSSRVQDAVTLAETLGLNRFNPDYYALELGNHVLGGGFYASRLYRDLRENSGLTYYVGSSLNSGKTRTTYSVTYGCDPPNVSKARAIIERDLRAMQTAPVTAHELRGAKALSLREIPLSESSISSIAGGWIARSTLGLPLNEPELAARRYVQLTAAEIQAAFAKWLRPDGLVQVTEGPNPK
ncbi:MAG TPA: pitrilysin family protein [Terriglobia bacterium]|nr:pitrilysin family protein [Terriglobia bacterium]